MTNKTIKKGDCLANIAFAEGFDIDTLWFHGNNSNLRQVRNSPHVLLRGDRLDVPEKERREEASATEKLHRFRRYSSVVKLRLHLLKAGEPLANEAYRLKINGQFVEGQTDGDGLLEETILPLAKAATLTIDNDEYQLEIGSLDPEMEVSGVQARLNNLGYPCGKVDGEIGGKTIDALMLFQETYELEINGELDEATQAKLAALHGS